MGVYQPIIDDNVGNGIGACFVDNEGNNFSGGNCTIVTPEFLTVGSLPIFSASAGSNNVLVNANVSWTAMSNDSWISIDTSSGSGNITVSVSVTENLDTNSRTGTVIFTQDPGGDNIVRTLNVTQEGVDLTDLYDLINTGLAGDPVTIDSFSQQQVDPDNNKFNYASNTLDKDFESHWTAQDGDILPGDIKGDGEYVIYDLGSSYELDLLQIATDDKDDPYGLQVWLSTTGTSASDFTMILPSTGDLLITTTVGVNDAFDQYEITASARYVKLIGFGRFDSAGNQRQSPWNNITEIEFYGTSVLSIDTINLDNEIVFYPIPVKNMLYINNLDENFQSIKIYSMDGKELLEKKVTHSNEELSIDLSFLAKGTYIISLNKGINSITKMIVVD